MNKTINFPILIVLFLFVLVLCFSTAYAMTFDNVKLISDDGKKVTIRNSFGFGSDVISVKMISNTNYCYTECSSVWNVTIYDNSDNFLDKIRFMNPSGKELNIKYRIEYIDYYKEVKEDTYDISCNQFKQVGNGTEQDIKKCQQTKSDKKKTASSPVWKEVNNKKLAPGVYTIKLTGYKKVTETIDWIPTFAGQEINEWAWWFGVQPTGYWRLNETSGNATDDGSGNHKGVNVGNNVTYGTGKLSNAVLYNGDGALFGTNYINVGDYNDFGSTSFTLALWVKASSDFSWSGTNIKPIMGKSTNYDPSNSEWNLRWNTDGTIRWAIKDNVGTLFTITTASSYADNNWHRLVIIRDNSGGIDNAVMYVDNTTVGATGGFSGTNFNTPAELTFGYQTAGSSFTAHRSGFDDIQLYLAQNWTQSDISQDWNNGNGKEADGATNPPPTPTPYTINAVTYNSTTYETSTENLAMNITYNSTLYSSISSNFVYNGTKYTADRISSGNNTIFYKSLGIPFVNSTHNSTFYWEILLTNATGVNYFNSSFYNQTVNPIVFTYCSAAYATIAANFSIFDESNITTPIITNFDAAFTYGIGGLVSGKTTSFNLTGLSNYTFCVNINRTFTVNSDIQISSPGYSLRNYNFRNDNMYLNSTITERILYLISSAIDSNINIEVKNPGLQPIKNYVVKIYRFYPSTNSYSLIENQETDDYGRVVAKLVENDVSYKFEFYNSSGTLKKTANIVKIICPSTYCVLQFVIEDETDYFGRFDNVTSYDYSLSFDNNTNAFTLSWNDNTGDSPTHRLYVRRNLLNGSTTVCDLSLSGIVGSLNCSVGNQKASYIAQAFRSVSGTESIIATLTSKVGDISGKFKKDGLFWAFILLFTMIGIGSFHPPSGIFLFLAGFAGLGLLGLISFNAPIFIGMLVIGVLFIWSFRA